MSRLRCQTNKPKLRIKWLQKNVKIIEWPSQAYDLNTIENIVARTKSLKPEIPVQET